MQFIVNPLIIYPFQTQHVTMGIEDDFRFGSTTELSC